MSEVLGQSQGVGRMRRILVVYLRLVAIIVLGAGMARAAYLLGVDFDAPPFLSQTLTWQLGLLGLLFLNLFSSVGLWLVAPWGQVLWIMASLVEITMHTAFSSDFGADNLRVAGTIVLILVYTVLLVFSWLERSRRR